MIERIDLFMPPSSQYGVLHHFTKMLFEALMRQGISCRLLIAERTNPEPFLEGIFNNPPLCTLSFNGLLPDEENRFFCDLIKIPHLACLVDSPNQFMALTQSPLSIVSCTDQFSCEFFRGMNFENVFFLPHAVESTLERDPNQEYKYDVTMLASFIDHEAIRDTWKEKYSPQVCTALDEAITTTLSDQETPYVKAFVEALDKQAKNEGIIPNTIDFVEVLDDLEMYIRGKDRIELLKGVKDAQVHLFGSSPNAWKKYLGDSSNIVYHDAVPYEEAVEVMKQSKILLNSCAWIKNGTHERILAGLACGSLPITSENVFMNEHFKDKESILYYKHGHWNDVNALVNHTLANEDARAKIVAKGREIVMRSHTWDTRAKELLENLEPILARIYHKK